MKSLVRNELSLRQLTAGNAEPILVADFQAFSTAPRLSQLLSERAEDHPVYQIDPVGILSGDMLYLSLSGLAAASADEFLSSGPADGPVFVVGHCSAAAVAMHVAKALERSRQVTVILLQPAWPGKERVRARFAEFAVKLEGADHSCPDLDGDPWESVARMEQALREYLAAMAASRGLDGSANSFSALLTWYRAWLAFLLACGNDRPAARATAAAAVKVLVGAAAEVAVPGLSPDAYQVVRVPVLGEEEDVATPELAETVLEQLVSC
jgi:thioesterase domain-containing protein